MKAAKLTYRRAETVAQAIELSSRSGGRSKLMAGGQSLMPMMNLRMMFADEVIDISGIAALRQSRTAGERLFVGAATTHAMIEDGKVEDPARGYLRHVACGIAFRSVRNRGTVGGSLVHADPAADWPTALRALDAVAVIEGEEGEREVAMADFQRGLMETCLAEADILKGVLLPRLSSQARWSYMKFCRKAGEFAHSIGAVVVDPLLGMANVVLGAVGGKPVRLARVSDRVARGLTPRQAGESAFADLLAEDLASTTDLNPSSYEFQLHKTIIRRAVAEALRK